MNTIKKRVDNLEALKAKSWIKFLKLMPTSLIFCGTWNGLNHKYKFVHKTLGPFEAWAFSIYNYHWTKGFSGHPNDKPMSSKRKVEIVELGLVFATSAEAAAYLGIRATTLSHALAGRRPAKGFTIRRVAG